MQLTFQIPDPVAPRVVDAICTNFNYQDTKQEGETRPEFAKRMIRQWIKSQVSFHEVQKAQGDAQEQIRLAGEAAAQKAEAEIEVT
jgi:regulator of protease activity HflC (stomatin/prohibitin superfamily)